MSGDRAFENAMSGADQLTNYALSDERREAIEAALYGDLDDPTLDERLERIADALYVTMALQIEMGSKGRSSQGTIDFMTAELRAGRSKTESVQALMVMRKRLRAERESA